MGRLGPNRPMPPHSLLRGKIKGYYFFLAAVFFVEVFFVEVFFVEVFFVEVFFVELFFLVVAMAPSLGWFSFRKNPRPLATQLRLI
jgi:hypothetical protein